MAEMSTQKVGPGDLSGPYATKLKAVAKNGFIAKVLDKQPGIFGKSGRAFQEQIVSRLGWTDVVAPMKKEIPRMQHLAQDVKEAGYEHLFVLGMGGSSLCPEVFGTVFGKQSWLKTFTIMDTTAPSKLESILKQVEPTKSFFIVASKSGTTIETLSQFRYFFHGIKDVRPLKVGNYFAAITDERSELHRMARRNRFREVFLNPEDIGGRYSALSYFGLVPGAFTKMNMDRLLANAEDFLTEMDEHPDDNDALRLGVLMGCGAIGKRDKLRFVASKKVAPFIPWIEQLVAESTGKEGKGIIPVEGNFSGAKTDFSGDGVFVYYSAGDKLPFYPPTGSAGKSIPRVSINLSNMTELGAEILKWEMATVVASSIIGVNPFNEPNVTESKENTAKFLKGPRGPRKKVIVEPLFGDDQMDIMKAEGLGVKKPKSSEEMIASFIAGVKKGDYVSLLCYTEMTPAIEKKLTAIRDILGKKYNILTLRGYGPRYLHSIGQLYKGGPQKGHFIVFEREYEKDYDIPMLRISFERLIKAQAKGDIAALTKRKRPLITVNLKMNPVAGLSRFLDLIGG